MTVFRSYTDRQAAQRLEPGRQPVRYSSRRRAGDHFPEHGITIRFANYILKDRGSRVASLDPRSSRNDNKSVSAADDVGEILVVSHVDTTELLDHLANFGSGDESVL